MKKNRLYLIAIMGLIGSIFSGCSANYENINPSVEETKEISSGSEQLRKLYEKQAYIKGEADGFEKGLAYGKKVVNELLNDLRAKQFAVYLHKERYIEAGPIYINPETGEIELGKMEMRRPFTVADIFSQFGGEIPIKSDIKIKEDLLAIDDEIKKLQSSVLPDIIVKKDSRQEVNNENINGYLVSMYNTNSNIDILTKFNYKFGTIDDKLIIKFEDKKTADVFCRNFGCID